MILEFCDSILMKVDYTFVSIAIAASSQTSIDTQ